MKRPNIFVAFSLVSVIFSAFTVRSFHQVVLQRRPSFASQWEIRHRSWRREHPHSRKQTSLYHSIINTEDFYGNFMVLTGCAAAAQVLGNSTTVGRLMGAPVAAMSLAFTAASIGILPSGGTVAARQLQSLSLSLATPAILIGADVRNASKRCGPLLLSFAIAACGTSLGAVVGWLAIGPALQSALGAHDSLVLAAALFAKNVGGGINYVAVCQTLGASPMAVAAGLCVDNIFALVYFPLSSALGSLFEDADGSSNNVESVSQSPSLEVTVQGLTNVLCLSTLLLWLGQQLGGRIGAALPVCTLFSVLVASVGPRRWLRRIQPTADKLGMLCLFLFFATAGSPGIAVAQSVRASIGPLAIFLACLYGVHGLILYVCRLLFQDAKRHPWCAPQRLLIASSASIGGPATAIALAQSAKWPTLTVPAVLVGNIGYAVATFSALLFHTVFKTS